MQDGTRTIAAVIVAAGRGERAASPGHGPKQYRMICGSSVLLRSLEALDAALALAQIVIVIHPDDEDLARSALGEAVSRVALVRGAATRQGSVRAGLEAIDAATDIVLIHDAARPMVDAATVRRVAGATDRETGAIAAVPVPDTLKLAAPDLVVERTVPRERLYAAQTPQGFPFRLILDAHREAAMSGRSDFTDDASIAESFGLRVKLVEGSNANRKITFAEDIEMSERQLGSAGLPDLRTGNGYDVHAFEPGDAVVLCGVRITHDRRLSGHSDADVGLHALTDALLATCGAGDIGTHFPPSDPQWKGAASRIFVEHAAAIIRDRGGRIANADVTLICEGPKVGPHREAMVAAMAGMLGIEAGRVSVKATTNEGLGFLGRGEGIAAIATATVAFPGYLP